MAQNESFDLSGPCGRLEALLMLPDAEPVAVAVICHAHPLHGGMMHFKVVFRAAKALQEVGLAVLRFNFRGVGRSQGSHDDGRGEQDDVVAALDELSRRFPRHAILLGGFSFGSTMALKVAARDDRPRAVVAMGFPLAQVEDRSFLDGIATPRLFVQGEHDQFGPREEIETLVRALPPPADLEVIGGADHFFNGHLDEIHTVVGNWAENRPWEASFSRGTATEAQRHGETATRRVVCEARPTRPRSRPLRIGAGSL